MSNILNLAFNVGQALNIPEGDFVRSIFGEFATWRPELESGFKTEYAAAYPLSLAGIGTAWKALAFPLPSFPWDPPQGSARIDRPREDGAASEFPNERWFLINGICTDRRVVEINRDAISAMFGREVTVLYNACNGVLLDLLECAVGKQWDATTDAARVALPEILDALRDPEVERVVLISHSQGTIVAAVVLKALEELLTPSARGHNWNRHEISAERAIARKITRLLDWTNSRSQLREISRVQSCLQAKHIAKLEMYNFANCATSMEPFVVVGDTSPQLAPWIESYGNEYDLVARFGVLAPTHGIGSARIGGERYIRRDTWGHLLNAHYLFDFLKEAQADGCVQPPLSPFSGNLQRRPRLLEYLGGRRPARTALPVVPRAAE